MVKFQKMQEISIKSANLKADICIKCIGVNIRNLRLAKGLTQFDVECLTNIDKSAISALERGVYKNITIKTLAKLSELFGVSIEQLIK